MTLRELLELFYVDNPDVFAFADNPSYDFATQLESADFSVDNRVVLPIYNIETETHDMNGSIFVYDNGYRLAYGTAATLKRNKAPLPRVRESKHPVSGQYEIGQTYPAVFGSVKNYWVIFHFVNP